MKRLIGSCSRGLLSVLGGLGIALLLSGCMTIRHGGAPEPAFNYTQDLKDLEDLYAPAASIKAMGKSPDVNKRNEFIDGRLALLNIRHVRFVRDLGVDRQQLDAATDILLLGLGLAGASTSSLRSATNLATASAGVTGTKVVIDKHFYFDKTVQALVSTMNAKRKEVLVRILEGRNRTIAEYPVTRVLDDLADYEQAGTLLGAIATLQADAADKEMKADEKVRELVILTPEQRSEKEKLRTALDTLAPNNEQNLGKINSILKELGSIKTDLGDFKTAAATVVREFNRARPDAYPTWRQALKKANVTVAD
jgi:hypothetical protein